MIRHGSFDFLAQLDRLRSPTVNEMTSPVTVSLEGLIAASRARIAADETVRIALDWCVHVGGSLRDQLEAEIERDLFAALTIEIELLMRPDPVVAFEVSSWLERRLVADSKVQFVLRAETRDAWISNVPGLADFAITAPEHGDVTNEVIEARDGLGLSDVVSVELATEFVPFMRDQVGVDLFEPPWMFWSRLPVWMKHKKRDADVSELEARLSFLRASLSPQDETSETASLESDVVMMNPTFEAIERSRDFENSREAPLLARARRIAQVTSRTITSLEALILDHVRESFRVARARLIVEVELETGIRKEFVERAVVALVRDGFLLGRSH